MRDEDKEIKLLLQQYEEAGHLTRQHETLTRASASIFVAVLVALAGAVTQATIGSLTRIVFAFAGFGISLLALNIVRRHQLYYKAYMERLHKIEKANVFRINGRKVLNLYTCGEDATRNSCTYSNKSAFALFFLATAIFFVLFVIIILCLDWSKMISGQI